MKFCVGIGILDKNIIYMIIGGLFRLLVSVFLDQKILSSIIEHSLVMNFSSSFGLMLSFIPLIIYKIRNKEFFCFQRNKKYDLVYNNLYEALIYGKYKWILLSSVVDFIQTMVMDQFCAYCPVNMWIFDILFISIFSYFIFKIKLYLHHYLSVLLIICIGIVLDVYLQHYIFNDKDYFVSMIFKFFSEIFLSLGFIIDKYTMEKKFCSPYELCFYHGFINFIFSLICLPFSKEIGLDNYSEFFSNPSLEKFYAFIILMLTQFIFNIFILIINKNTTPCHILIMIIIGLFGPYIRALGNDAKTALIIMVGLLFILFFTLVFNEILEINCFGLQENTKKNIANRATIERIIIGEINIEDDEDICEEEEEEYEEYENINDSKENSTNCTLFDTKK